MAENKKEFDWLASRVKNPDLTISDFKKIGITPETAELKDRSEYENLPQVKEVFKDENGDFDRTAFNNFYDNALLSYNNFAKEEYVPKATELFGYLDSQWDRPQGSKVMDTTPRFLLEQTAPMQSFGIDYINKYGQGPFAKQSAREIAQQQKVVDFETGQTLDWTPDDKSGLIDALFRPTLVLASYDKDEYDEKGNLLHKKGDLKYNDDGFTYYETLGNRSISGKQVLAYSDSITREGSWLNKADFFDSDGLDKSLIGTAAKTVFTTIPYLIPGVGEVFGGVAAIIALNRVLPVLGKAVAGIANGRGEDSFTEQMNKWEGLFARFDPSVSDHSQEHLPTFENLGNLITSISGQLFQQKVVGAIPMLLNKSGEAARNAEWGRALAYGYMSLTSAQDSFNTFKEAGASDMVAGWAFVANAIALGSLMATDYGKGLLFKGSWLDENFLKEPARKAAEEVKEQLTKGIENAAPKERAKFIQHLVNIYNKHFSSMSPDTFLNRGLSEALEETMEEGIIDVQKALTSVAQAIGVNVGDQKLDFGLSWTDVAQRYGMAAAGGFLGGGIFHLQGKWNDFLANDMVQHTDEDTLQKLTYYIGQGRGQEIRDLYRNWHKRGLLGSTSLGTNLTTITSFNGSEVVSEPAGDKLSQNDVVFNTMMKYIDSIESTISKEGLLKDVGSLVRNAINGYKETDRALRADTLINLGVHDLLIKDIYDVGAKIVSKNAEIQSEINNLTVQNDSPDAKKQTEENIRNSEKLKTLQAELDELRLKRDSILSGENNWRYVGQAVFASNTELAKNFIDLSKEKYSQVVLGREYKSLSTEEKENLDKRYEEYMKDEGKNKLFQAFDLYLGLSRRSLERLNQENEALKGHTLNETREVGTRFQTSFVKRLTEWQKVSKEYGELVAKADKTEDDKSKIQELKHQLESIETSLAQDSQNAYGMLIHPSQDNVEIVNLLAKGLLTSEETSKAFSLVKQMYQDYSTNGAQLNNDYEYETLLRSTVNSFLNVASVQRRVDNWLSNIEYRESAEGQDMGLWTSWLQETGLYDLLYNEDEDLTNYESEFLQGIKNLANTFITNLGVNNKVAKDALNQIRSEMQEKGFSSDDINALIAEITPQYVEDGEIKPITNFIEEIDKLRENVKYSSFVSLLQDFTTDLFGERSSLVDLIENEKRKLANSNNLEDYFIRNPEVISELNDILDLINVVRGMIKGAVDKTNSSINSSKHGEDYIPLPELDENTARILYRQSFDLENEIRTLLDISKWNSQRTLKIHEEIDKHMRGKFIYALVNNPAFVQKFGEKFYTVDADGKKDPIDIAKISSDLLRGRIDLSKTETADPGDLLRFEVEFETSVYNAVTNSTIGKDSKEIAKALVDLFPDAWTLDTTVMSTDTETITSFSLLSYLEKILAVPSEAFYTKYETVTQAEDSKFAPIYNQEMALRDVVAAVANMELINAVTNELKKRVDTSKIDPKDTESIKWISNLTVLNNIVVIPGGAGCGKSTAIAQNAAKMFNDYDHEYFCLAPEIEQAENLAKAVGENIRHTDKATFFQNVFKVDLQKYRFNQKTGHSELIETPTINNKLFDKSKKLKILFIDEVSLFTESELKLISDYAIANGIVVVGLGDPVQNSAKIYTDEILSEAGATVKNPNKAWYSTGLEDCLYFGSSYLTSSLRPSNLAKFENYNILSNTLNQIMQKWKQERWLGLNELDAFVPSQIELKFFENVDTFYGDQIVENDADLITLAKKYAKRGKVTIITDDLNKYPDLPDGVEKRAYNKMQGMETDFVLVDVDFVKNNSINGATNKYATLRDLYTITQRSTIGTIIKKDGLNDALPGLTWKNTPEVGQRLIMGEQDIATFKQKRGEILATLHKGLNLFDFIKDLKSIQLSTPAVSPVQTTPSANPVINSSNQSITTPPVTSVPPTPTPPSTPSGNETQTAPPASNPTGLPPAPEQNSTVPQLPPPPKPVSYQQSAQAVVTKGNSAIYTSQFNRFVFDQGFSQVERQSPNSLYNWKTRHSGENVQIPKDVYPKIMLYLSSAIRTKLPVNLDVLFDAITKSTLNKNVDASGFITELKSILKVTPEIYISPYNNEFRIITAIYRSGEDYLEIPIALTKSSATGKYIGEFKRLKNISKKENNEKWRSLDAFLDEHSELIVTPEWGITAREYNKDEKNAGKVDIVMTDEAGYIPYLYGWYIPDGQYEISHYNDLCHMCIQKPVNPQTVLQFVTSLKYHDTNDPKTIEILLNRGLWEDPQQIIGYLTGNDLISLPSGADYYKVLNYSGNVSRAWQVLPIDRALTFMRVGLESAYKTSDFGNMLTNMTVFMNHKFTPNKRLNDELTAMILSDGETSYIIKQDIQDGQLVGYRAMLYINGTYMENDDDQRFSYSTKFPYTTICQKLFKKPIVTTEFIRLINPVNTDGYFIQKLSPNDNILMLFGTQHYNMEQLTNKMLQSDEFINGVYVNDAAGDFLANGSAFRRFIGNKSGYWIKGDIWNSVWGIDESAVVSVTRNAQNDAMKQQLDLFNAQFEKILNVLPEQYKQKWRDKYNRGYQQIISGKQMTDVISELVNGINNNMKFTLNSWEGYVVTGEIGNNPGIRKVFNQNIWLDRRVRSLAKAKGIAIDDNSKIIAYDRFGSVDNLNKWGYTIVHIVNSNDEIIGYGVLTKTKTGFEFNSMAKSTYNAYTELREYIFNNSQVLKPLLSSFESYLHDLVFTNKDVINYDPIKLTQLINNTSELSTFSSKLNTYLEQRLKNSEC